MPTSSNDMIISSNNRNKRAVDIGLDVVSRVKEDPGTVTRQVDELLNEAADRAVAGNTAALKALRHEHTIDPRKIYHAAKAVHHSTIAEQHAESAAIVLANTRHCLVHDGPKKDSESKVRPDAEDAVDAAVS
ncbi:hypothetical protein PENSPDRAFT_654028 [Peniophora sp. CONT]|nr:hypothetical protein PENSPDRAFT_654028 [Peniophora sp. CONT]